MPIYTAKNIPIYEAGQNDVAVEIVIRLLSDITNITKKNFGKAILEIAWKGKQKQCLQKILALT